MKLTYQCVEGIGVLILHKFCVRTPKVCIQLNYDFIMTRSVYYYKEPTHRFYCYVKI